MMNFEPIASASLAIQIHLFTVLPAFVIGTAQFVLPKGGPLHRNMGYAFMILMVITAIAAFFIPSFMGGRFSFIHLFIPLTLISVPRALWAARRGKINTHKYTMIALYVGALLIAGGLALAPDRILGRVLFG